MASQEANNKPLTLKEYNKLFEDLIVNIKSSTPAFINDTPEKQKKRIERAKRDIFFAAKTYFPHLCESEFGDIHVEMHAETEVMGSVIGVAGFRGMAKTTLLSEIKTTWQAMFKKIKYCCQVAIDEKSAIDRSAAIFYEFKHNKRIIHDFGYMLKRGSQNPGKFVLKNGVKIHALGYGQAIRGKKHIGARPDWIVIDDLEAHETYNPDIAKKKLQYVLEEAYGALDRGRGRVVWLGNLTHRKSALNLFKNKSDEKPSKYRKLLIYKLLIEKNGKPCSAWKERFTMEDIERIREVMGELGFQRHMQMNPIVEGNLIKEKWLKYWTVLPTFDRLVTYCDPSWKGTKTSDFKAIVTIGLFEGHYYIVDLWVRKATILDMLHQMYDIHRRFPQTTLFMEANFNQGMIWDEIPKISDQYGYLLPVNEVLNMVNKEIRISNLQPTFQRGWIYLPDKMTDDREELRDELLAFPSMASMTML